MEDLKIKKPRENKVMTQEDKAKRYDEALHKAKRIINVCVDDNTECRSMIACIQELFPELKEESEGERIRKALIKYYSFDKDGGSHALDNITPKQILVWLEKQGEQKPVLEMKTPEESLGIDSNTYDKIVDECIYGGQNPGAWSEEEENVLEDIEEAIINYWHGDTQDILLDWLKSLRPQNRWISINKEVYVKEPILAQKKDKSDPFDGFVVCCDHTLTPNVYERYMILGNIVSQNTWKPSDEQMRILDLAIRCGINRGTTEETTLVSLFNDLKKLREE